MVGPLYDLRNESLHMVNRNNKKKLKWANINQGHIYLYIPEEKTKQLVGLYLEELG